jgi:hypothetical protein
MAKLPLDLKHFKKTHSDKHTTTLEHKAGHSIKLTHSALSPEMREMLDKLPVESKKQHNPKLEESKKLPPRMAEGGKVESLNSMGQESSDGDSNEANPAEVEYHAMPEDAEVGKNQPASPEMQPAPQQPVAQQPVQPQAPVTINIGQPQIPENLANKQEAAPAPKPEYSKFLTSSGQTPYGITTEQQQALILQQEQLDKQKQNALKTGENQPVSNVGQTTPTQPMPQEGQDPYGLEAQQQMYSAGVSTKAAGILGEAAAQAARGAAESKMLQNQIATQQKMANDYNTHYNDLQSERDSFMSDIQNQHIDPEHYMSSLNPIGKALSIIGVVLGGMGAGATGGRNVALDTLNGLIERDINAQKSELGKKENLLNANLKHFGNLRDALDMTRVMQNDIIANKIRQAAANSASPMAQANAMKLIGDLEMQSSPLLSQIATRRTMLNSLSGATQNPDQMGQVIQAMRQINPEMAKSMEDRYVPGVGMAQIPVPREARDTLIAKQQLSQMANDFYRWSEQHSGAVDPRIVNEGRAKAAELQSLYRNAINGGVFKKGEQEFIDQIIDSDPTKFFNNIRVLPKLKEVIKNNQTQMNVLKKAYGFPIAQIQESAPVIPKK